MHKLFAVDNVGFQTVVSSTTCVVVDNYILVTLCPVQAGTGEHERKSPLVWVAP
jgi:hypothetical protein